MGGVFASLDRDDDVLVVGLNRAVDVLAKKLASVRTLGPHPSDREPVLIRKGRFGPYAQHGSKVANLPRDVSMDDMTLAEAVALLAERGKTVAAKGRGKGKSKAKPTSKAKTPAAARPRIAAAKVATAKPKAAKTKPKAKPNAKHKAKLARKAAS